MFIHIETFNSWPNQTLNRRPRLCYIFWNELIMNIFDEPHFFFFWKENGSYLYLGFYPGKRKSYYQSLVLECQHWQISDYALQLKLDAATETVLFMKVNTGNDFVLYCRFLNTSAKEAVPNSLYVCLHKIQSPRSGKEDYHTLFPVYSPPSTIATDK
jgi:hypothetical protein